MKTTTTGDGVFFFLQFHAWTKTCGKSSVITISVSSISFLNYYYFFLVLPNQNKINADVKNVLFIWIVFHPGSSCAPSFAFVIFIIYIIDVRCLPTIVYIVVYTLQDDLTISSEKCLIIVMTSRVSSVLAASTRSRAGQQ